MNRLGADVGVMEVKMLHSPIAVVTMPKSYGHEKDGNRSWGCKSERHIPELLWRHAGRPDGVAPGSVSFRSHSRKLQAPAE